MDIPQFGSTSLVAIDGGDGYFYVSSDAGIDLSTQYPTLAAAQAAIETLTNPNSWAVAGFIFAGGGTDDNRIVYRSPDGGYWIGAPRAVAYQDMQDATRYSGTAQSMADWIARSIAADKALAAEQNAAFNKQMATVFAVVGAAVGASYLLAPGGIASGSIAASDAPTLVSASEATIPEAGAGWVSSGDLPFTALEASGGTLSAPTSIMLSSTPSWMESASSILSKATGGAAGSGGAISAGGVLSTLATIAKALTGGAKPAIRTNYAPGINPATGLPFDSSGINAQSISGMLPYLALAAIAVVALRGK